MIETTSPQFALVLENMHAVGAQEQTGIWIYHCSKRQSANGPSVAQNGDK
jgi:hypothetical protein